MYYIHCVQLQRNKKMQKNIDIDEVTLTKLKILSVFENNSIKGLMEQAVSWFVAQKEKQHLDRLSKEEKEDLGLFLLLQQADRTDMANRDDIM